MSHATPQQAMPVRQLGLVLAMTAALSGCATSHNPRDPLEGLNRAVFSFNDTVDKVALKPAATVYQKVLPSFVQTGVKNFFGNLSDVWTAANNLMQGKGQAGMSDVTRVALNSTFGVLGLFDIASEAGLQKHKEDFGQTLGYWGVKPGPYLVLPLLGPSTMRDTVALPADFAADPWSYKNPIHVRNIGMGVRVIDARASLLDSTGLLEDAALDRYEFLRDGYLQQRDSKVYDGDPPAEKKAPRKPADDDMSKPAEQAPAALAPAVVPSAAAAPADVPVQPKQAEASAPAAPLSSEPVAHELTKDTAEASAASL